MATASARHILVNDEAFCRELKEKINSGEITLKRQLESTQLVHLEKEAVNWVPLAKVKWYQSLTGSFLTMR